MESIWATLSSFPPASVGPLLVGQEDGLLKQHVVLVKRLVESQRAAIEQNAAPLLAKLDPAVNSVSFLAVLKVCFDAPEPASTIGWDHLLNHTFEFLLNFEPRYVRYYGSSFRLLLERFIFGGIVSPLLTVEVIASALLRLEPSGSMFTSIHLPLIQLAYTCDCIEPATKLIDHRITLYPGLPGQKDSRLLCDRGLSPVAFISTDTGLTESVKSTTVLEYELVSALIYISQRDWQKAHKALERAITYPTKDRGVSKIMVEAFKKWLLVGLLNDGEEPILPKFTTAAAKKMYSTMAPEYKTIANLFDTGNPTQLKSEVQANLQKWEEDGNQSLVNEVMTSYQKWQIIKLRSIYQQVSVSFIRLSTFNAATGDHLASDEEVIGLIQGILESGMLEGELRIGSAGEESYLMYQNSHHELTDAEFVQEVARYKTSIASLTEQYIATSAKLTSSKDYVAHLVREQKRSEKDSADPGLGFDHQIEDEDLMTGVVAHG